METIIVILCLVLMLACVFVIISCIAMMVQMSRLLFLLNSRFGELKQQGKNYEQSLGSILSALLKLKEPTVQTEPLEQKESCPEKQQKTVMSAKIPNSFGSAVKSDSAPSAAPAPVPVSEVRSVFAAAAASAAPCKASNPKEPAVCPAESKGSAPKVQASMPQNAVPSEKSLGSPLSVSVSAVPTSVSVVPTSVSVVPASESAAASESRKTVSARNAESASASSVSAAPAAASVSKSDSVQGIQSKIVEKAHPEFRVPQESEFERKAQTILRKVWKWVIVGDEFRREGTSMEYAVASTWLLRISILILVCGMGFFLKYSIQNNYLGVEARVILSYAAAAAVLGVGIRLNRGRYQMIGLGLIGAAIAAFYFSCYAAGPLYHLIPMWLAFVLMVLVTAGASYLALTFDALLLAILGTIGGYLTPIMLSTGSRNLAGLYSYLIVIGLGLLWVARQRHWYLLNALSFLFTYGIYFATMWDYAEVEYPVCILFLTGFFLLFSIIPVHRNLIRRENTTLIEILMLIVNTILYFSPAYLMTRSFLLESGSDSRYLALLPGTLTLFYFLFVFVFARIRLQDRNLLVTLIGFCGFFATVTLPILFSGNILTISWTLLALLFLFLSYQTSSRFLRVLSFLLYGLAFAKILLVDFGNSFAGLNPENYWHHFAARILNFVIFGGSLFAMSKILNLQAREDTIFSGKNDSTLPVPSIPAVAIKIAGTVFLLFYAYLELGKFSWTVYPPMRFGLLSLVWCAAIFICLLNWMSHSKEKPAHGYLATAILLTLGLLIKILVFDVVSGWGISCRPIGFACHAYSWEGLGMHMTDLVPVLGLMWFAILTAVQRGERQIASFFAVCGLLVLFTFSTLEVSTCLRFFVPGFRSGGISILWGLFALGMLLFGLFKRLPYLRYAGLLLFLVTAGKVFFVDLRALTEIWRYVAFLVFGAMMLVGAILYVKYQEVFQVKKKE